MISSRDLGTPWFSPAITAKIEARRVPQRFLGEERRTPVPFFHKLEGDFLLAMAEVMTKGAEDRGEEHLPPGEETWRKGNEAQALDHALGHLLKGGKRSLPPRERQRQFAKAACNLMFASWFAGREGK